MRGELKQSEPKTFLNSGKRKLDIVNPLFTFRVGFIPRAWRHSCKIKAVPKMAAMATARFLRRHALKYGTTHLATVVAVAVAAYSDAASVRIRFVFLNLLRGKCPPLNSCSCNVT